MNFFPSLCCSVAKGNELPGYGTPYPGAWELGGSWVGPPLKSGIYVVKIFWKFFLFIPTPLDKNCSQAPARTRCYPVGGYPAWTRFFEIYQYPDPGSITLSLFYRQQFTSNILEMGQIFKKSKQLRGHFLKK